MRFNLAILCALTPLMAQILPGPITRIPPFPEALRSYLELSTDQVNAIQRLNAMSRQFEMEKITRAAQVQFELAQETAKPTLDAMALGVRHLELEAIRRELGAQQRRTNSEIQKLLTPAQKTKVQALVDAMLLQPVICDAQQQNILPVPTVPTFAGRGQGLTFSDGSSQGLASFLLGSPTFSLGPGCLTSRGGLIGGLIQ